VLAITHHVDRSLVIATVLVFTRDIIILIVCTLLYITGAMKLFRPSLFGKANTLAQIVTVPLVLLDQVYNEPWITTAKMVFIYATIALTVISGVHYLVQVAFKLRHASARTTDIRK
jgi:cardiolipin synthase